MIRRPLRSTRTDTLCPYTTLFRSLDAELIETVIGLAAERHLGVREHLLHLLADQRVEVGLAARIGFERRIAPGLADRTLQHLLRIHLPAIVEGAHQDEQEQRSEEHTSELQSLMRISYAVFCLKKKNTKHIR